MINMLDPYLIEALAAGEVVERPLSVVKELVENSIDAGSKLIVVEIKKGGKTYIRVTDDGDGIPEPEIEKSYLRHATSKIRFITDLEDIHTLGFRGEALASIVAVSHTTIISKPDKQDVGIKLTVSSDRTCIREEIGCNKGTTVIVQDLFYNTPARQKYMNSDASETSAIVELLEHMAIYYSDIKFMLISNNLTVLTTSGDGKRLNTIKSVYPTKEYQDLIPLSGIGITGFASNPGTTLKTRRGQLFFVNGRLVESETMTKAVAKGYGDRVFSGFPICFLFLDVNPKELDANVHPTKLQVKFLNDEKIANDIADAIKTMLKTMDSVPYVDSSNSSKIELSENPSDFEDEEQAEPFDIKDYLASIQRDIQAKPEETPETISEDKPISRQAQPIHIEASPSIPFDFNLLEFKSYIFKTYIVCQYGEELVLLDQHAAHERVNYENLVDAYNNSKASLQAILTPVTCETSASVYNSDRWWLEALNNMGFDVSDFGTNTFIIKGIPVYMKHQEAIDFAREFMEQIEPDMDNIIVINKLIMNSCKASVKANDDLSNLEILELINQLSTCKNPFSCPHGRPVFVKIDKSLLEKIFKRRV